MENDNIEINKYKNYSNLLENNDLENNDKYLKELNNKFIENMQNFFKKNSKMNFFLKQLIEDLKTPCYCSEKYLIQSYNSLYKCYLRNIASSLYKMKRAEKINHLIHSLINNLKINNLNIMINYFDIVYLIDIKKNIDLYNTILSEKITMEEITMEDLKIIEEIENKIIKGIDSLNTKKKFFDYLKKNIDKILEEEKLKNKIENFDQSSDDAVKFALERIEYNKKKIHEQEQIYKKNLSILEKTI